MFVNTDCVVKRVEPCGDHVRIELIDPTIEGKAEDDSRPDYTIRRPNVNAEGMRTLKVGDTLRVQIGPA